MPTPPRWKAAWFEELGCKASPTHLYLMEPALATAGPARSVFSIARDLVGQLRLDGPYRWRDDAAVIDAVLDHLCTGHATAAALLAQALVLPGCPAARQGGARSRGGKRR